MCYFINIRMRKIEKGEMSMLNEEICKLREELNNSITSGKDYKEIYEISIELDRLIALYYRKNIKGKKQKKKKLCKKIFNFVIA